MIAATEKDCWFTPRSILDRLGSFDLDPANSMPEKFPTAAKHYGPSEDGLRQIWIGRVWLNPPFSNARPWIRKLIEHGNGIALVFCRSDAVWFLDAVQAATVCLLVKGRIEFQRTDGKSSRCPLGCVLLAFGEPNAERLKASGLAGVYVESCRSTR